MAVGTLLPAGGLHAVRAVGSRVRWAPTRALRASVAAVDRVPVTSGAALTFDDGPHPEFTPRVLDLLAAHGVRATFFVVGSSVRRSPGLVRRIEQEGHVLGSHSSTHPDARRLGMRALHRDYADGRAALEDTLGRSVALFRPPNGTLDLKGAVVMRRLGLVPWLWNVDPQDWHPDTTEDQIVARCSTVAAGDVVLLHDGLERPMAPRALDRSPTVRALSRVLRALAERGVALGPVPPC